MNIFGSMLFDTYTHTCPSDNSHIYKMNYPVDILFDHPLSLEDILSIFTEKRKGETEKVFDLVLIKEDFKYPLYISDFCLSKGMSQADMRATSHRCTGCQILSRLTKNIPLNDKSVLKVARSEEKIEVIRKQDVNVVYAYNLDAHKDYKAQNVPKTKNYNAFFTTSNSQLNLYAVGCQMERVLELNLEPKILNMYICDMNIFFKFKGKHFVSEDLESVEYFVLQLCILLKELRKANFTHGEPSFKYLTIHRESFQDVLPFTLQILPSYFSSIDVGSARLAYRNKPKRIGKIFEKVYPNLTTTETSTKYMTGVPVCSGYNAKRMFVYKIGREKANFLRFYQSGSPFFSDSFDFVCFMVSALCSENFRTAFMKSDKLKSAWEGIFFGGEHARLTPEGNDFLSVFKVVSEVHLRSNAIEKFLEVAKFE